MGNLPALVARLASDRQAFFALIERASPEQLRARRRPEKWSVIEIAEHVVIAEREVLRGLPDFASLREEVARSPVRRMIVSAILKSPIKVEVPSRTMRPSGTRDVAELRRLWTEAEEWLTEFAGRSDLAGRAFFSHPIAGGLTMADAIRLDVAHIARHRRQVEWILATTGS